MKILIFTDTHISQVNGVQRCLHALVEELSKKQATVSVVSADDFPNVPLFGYKEIRLSLAIPRQILQKIRTFQPDAIHIVTEGPIGFIAAYVCQKQKIPYTTTFHTKFPEYLHLRNRLIKKEHVHSYLRYIHDGAEMIFISHAGLSEYLSANGYKRQKIIPVGIDHSTFFPGKQTLFMHVSKPTLLFVGRIAVEKNIQAFLDISPEYQKIVVGDGPLLAKYKKSYPDVMFLGKKTPKELAEIYRSVDVFVFPSLTDTLGLVNLEAMACGLPIIAYNLPDIVGIVEHNVTGILIPLDAALESGIPRALALDGTKSSSFASGFTWENYAQKFLENQFPISKNLWI